MTIKYVLNDFYKKKNPSYFSKNYNIKIDNKISKL